MAAIAEWVVGNFFGFLVSYVFHNNVSDGFSGAMGVFWLSLGVLYIPGLQIVQSYSPSGTDYDLGITSVGFNSALGTYLICWGLAIFVVLICSMKTNLTFIILFAVLDAGFFIFSASYFQVAAGNLQTAVVLKRVRSFGE